MPSLTPFIICSCSLVINFILIIISVCQISKINKLESKCEVYEENLADMLLAIACKDRTIKITQDKLESALKKIEQIKKVEVVLEKAPDETEVAKKTTTKKATAKKTTAKAGPVKKTTKKATTKKEDK